MRLLLDQDVYAVTARFLVNTEHDVILVAQIGLSQASDEEILRTAQEQNRILITRDRDYGNLVFVRAMGSGVIYLRYHKRKLLIFQSCLIRKLFIQQSCLSSYANSFCNFEGITLLITWICCGFLKN
ncbi:MAG: DUF5615 family PIN-like protein [Desmonostoc geniculatum HA4340-LM1]|nr:DUF5615 family PIN-like protein [Desmonostoc geniculatum HA4340-LM1]